MLHALVEGEAIVVAGGNVYPLSPGSVVFLPRGARHVLASGPGIEPAPADAAMVHLPDRRLPDLKLHGGGRAARFVCGTFQLAESRSHPLVAMLPEALVVDPSHADGPWLDATLRRIQELVDDEAAGHQAIVARLSDTLLVEALKTWAATEEESLGASWIRGLCHSRLGGVVLQLHRDPARAWTVDGLAAGAGMSRSAFAAAFRTVVGEPPRQFLTKWRMNVAARVLRESDFSVAEVAAKVGYASEQAFGKAFKRAVGATPAEFRRAARRLDGGANLVDG